MKKIKVLGIRKQAPSPQAPIEKQSHNHNDFSMADAEQAISEESVQVKPTNISSNGFTSMLRKILPTRDGMKSQVEKPMLIAKSGRKVTENEIKGMCEVCHGFDSYIFNCDVPGCKKSLCLKHVYFLDYGTKKTPYCLGHFKQAMDEYDTWQEHDNRRR